MRRDKRARRIRRGIKLAYGSLESHLPWTAGKKRTRKQESKRFHRKCVKEYSEIIKLLSELY